MEGRTLGFAECGYPLWTVETLPPASASPPPAGTPRTMSHHIGTSCPLRQVGSWDLLGFPGEHTITERSTLDDTVNRILGEVFHGTYRVGR